MHSTAKALLLVALLLVALLAARPASATDCPVAVAPLVRFNVAPTQVQQDASLKRAAIQAKAERSNPQIAGHGTLYSFYYADVQVQYRTSFVRSMAGRDVCTSPDGIFIELRYDRILYVPSEIASDPCVRKAIVEREMRRAKPEDDSIVAFAKAGPATYGKLFAAVKPGRGPTNDIADRQLSDQLSAIVAKRILPDLQDVHQRAWAKVDIGPIPLDACDGRMDVAIAKLRRD